MKKHVLGATALLLSVFMQAQGPVVEPEALTDRSTTFVLKVSPMTLLRNMWFTGYGEYALHDLGKYTVSLGLSPNLLPKAEGDLMDKQPNPDSTFFYDFDLDEAHSKSGFSIDPEFRMYTDEVFDGFYVGVYSSQRFSSARLLEMETPANDSLATATGGYQELKTHIGVYGLQIGFEKLFGGRDRFVFDAYFGIGYKYTDRMYAKGVNLVNQPLFDSNRRTIATRGNVSFGIRIF